jgi:hypothetical protein
MVLRGSALAPESSLDRDVKELVEAKERFELSQEQIADIHRSTVEDLLIRIERSDPKSNAIEQAEIIMLTAEIRKRVAALEMKRSQAWWEIITKQESIDRTLRQLLCGGIAGAIARSTVAPLDRVKILIQTASVTGSADKFNSIAGTAKHIISSEGVKGLWRGNLTNCVRVVPRKC